ncbi:predicted protein [Postia placenta Mad-698-R]|nr:predicted protein [Postia placenta Mad-698-R]
MALTSALPKTYKGVSCAGPHEPWEVITKELRAPAPNEVLLRVHASGICNSDHFVAEGTWPGISYPRITGHEVVGRIAAVGSALEGDARFEVGALAGAGWNGGYCGCCEYCRQGEYWTCATAAVTGFTFDGGHAEYMYVPEMAVVSLPEEALQDASYAELAPLLCAGCTAFGAITTTKWKPGDLCLVQGIGGLGHLAVQFAARCGLKVYAVSSGSSKRDLALSLGAHEYIDSSTTDVVSAIQALGGAQVIICTAPYAKHISAILPAVAKNGTITLISAATDGPVEVSNVLMNMNRATLRGFACGCAPDTEQCIRFSTLQGVKPMVQEFSVEQFTDAYTAVMANKARFRNVVVFP